MCSGASKFVKNKAYRFSGSQVSMISTSLDEKNKKRISSMFLTHLSNMSISV